jgi:8-oxo-dGTP pyrophosphatase MutT (NUDIX family)
MADPITPEVLRAAMREPPAEVVVEGARPAAVVIPVRFDRGLAEALAVVRASTLRDHAGEVGFPGGKPDPSDPDLRATALRELEEEIGVSASRIELFGSLTPVPVIDRRFSIHAFVGALAPDTPLAINGAELSEIVALPLHALVTGTRPHAAFHARWRGEDVGLAAHFWIAPEDRVAGDARAARVSLYGASSYIFLDLVHRLAAVLGTRVATPLVEDRPPWGERYKRFE